MAGLKQVSIDDIKWKWLSVHDNVRCEDCADLTNRGPWLYKDLPTIPGAGDTRCGKRCRCTLGPELTFDLYGRISNDSVLTMSRDTGDILVDFDGEKFGVISDMVREYEAVSMKFYGKNGDWNLPDSFYTDAMGLEERKKFLNSLINRIETDSLTQKDIADIMKRNPVAFSSGIPARLK